MNNNVYLEPLNDGFNKLRKNARTSSRLCCQFRIQTWHKSSSIPYYHILFLPCWFFRTNQTEKRIMRLEICSKIMSKYLPRKSDNRIFSLHFWHNYKYQLQGDNISIFQKTELSTTYRCFREKWTTFFTISNMI